MNSCTVKNKKLHWIPTWGVAVALLSASATAWAGDGLMERLKQSSGIIEGDYYGTIDKGNGVKQRELRLMLRRMPTRERSFLALLFQPHKSQAKAMIYILDSPDETGDDPIDKTYTRYFMKPVVKDGHRLGVLNQHGSLTLSKMDYGLRIENSGMGQNLSGFKFLGAKFTKASKQWKWKPILKPDGYTCEGSEGDFGNRVDLSNFLDGAGIQANINFERGVLQGNYVVREAMRPGVYVIRDHQNTEFRQKEPLRSNVLALVVQLRGRFGNFLGLGDWMGDVLVVFHVPTVEEAGTPGSADLFEN